MAFDFDFQEWRKNFPLSMAVREAREEDNRPITFVLNQAGTGVVLTLEDVEALSALAANAKRESAENIEKAV